MNDRILPAEQGLIVVGCSRRKTATSTPIPALDLYQGGCIPELRDRLGDNTQLRQRIRIVSALHGLLRADTPITPYDRRLTDFDDACRLRQRVTPCLEPELATVTHVLAVVEPLYLLSLEPIVRRPSVIRLHWIATARDWPSAAAVLDVWGWR